MAERPVRLILVPLESRAARTLVLVLTLAGAAWLATVIVRPAVATSLADRAVTPVELERALAWDPKNPELHIRLGRAYESLDDEKARSHFTTALRLRPTDAYVWMQLAFLADRQQDRARAREALATALRFDPHNVMIRWEAGLLALQWGEREQALDHFRYVMAVDPSQRDAAFQLARALLRPGEDPTTLLPREPDGLAGVLVAAVNHHDVALAEVAWAQRASLKPAIRDGIGRSYLQLLLDAGDGVTARGVWPTLVQHAGSARDENVVWNGGFEADRLLGWGLDWRIDRVWGVEVSLDHFVAARGSRSLRLTFNSFPSLDYAGVSQLVPVEPGREYQLRALAKALNFTTQSGLKLQVALPKDGHSLAETNAIAGTTVDWVRLETRFRIPAEVSLVLLRLRREPSPRPEGNLGGKVWLDEVSLL